MSLFWLFSLSFTLLALVFLFYPFRSALVLKKQEDPEEGAASATRKSQNIVIYEERIAELKRDIEIGRINQDEYKSLELELKRELLEYIKPDDSASIDAPVESGDQKSMLVIVFATVVFVVASAYALYFEWGEYDLQAQAYDMQFSSDEAEIAEKAAEAGDMETLVAQLHQKLKGAPDNIEGWTLLGRTSMNMQNYDLAIESFQMVAASLLKQQQNPAPVYGMIAQAYYFKNDVSGDKPYQVEVKDYLNRALAADPQEINAIGLKAIMAFEQRNYAEAIQGWRTLLEISPNHESAAAIKAGITRAQGLLDIETQQAGSMEVSNSTDLQTNDSATSFSGETSVEAEAPNDPNKPSISLAVSLSDELANKVSGNETLFVFAKALSGPPMPLAAARMRVSDLPATVLLDESSAMMPSLTLATVEQVSVTARVSKSGQPTAQTGDLFGTIDQVDVLGNQRTLDLVITEIH